MEFLPVLLQQYEAWLGQARSGKALPLKVRPSPLILTAILTHRGECRNDVFNSANATGRSLEEVRLHALKVGSPPNWDDVPDEYKAELAALDRLEDEALISWGV